jgi:hypothetical protein
MRTPLAVLALSYTAISADERGRDVWPPLESIVLPWEDRLDAGWDSAFDSSGLLCGRTKWFGLLLVRRRPLAQRQARVDRDDFISSDSKARSLP